jgi:beta-phosphoglucomutase-like phosphatase (HAD superfamily)
MTRTRAIVFDMDGVLIDSEELHAHAKCIAFAHAGIALTHADLRAYVGRSDAIMIDEIGARYEQSWRRSLRQVSGFAKVGPAGFRPPNSPAGFR